MTIDRWREDMLDAISRTDREIQSACEAEDLVTATSEALILIEDLVREISRLRILLRENGIDD